jgi:hypothetical protein
VPVDHLVLLMIMERVLQFKKITAK